MTLYGKSPTHPPTPVIVAERSSTSTTTPLIGPCLRRSFSYFFILQIVIVTRID